MSNIEREVCLKRIARDVFQVKKLKNVPVNIEVGNTILEIDKNLDISFLRHLEVQLPKMQINLVVEM